MYNFSRNRFFRQFSEIQKKYDTVLLSVVGILVVCGLTFLASTLSVKSQSEFYKEFLYQLLFGVWIGGFACFILARIDYHALFKHRKILLIGTFISLMFVSFFAGWVNISNMTVLQKEQFIDGLANPIIAPSFSNGAVRWVEIGSILFQPSEIAKLTLLVYFAAVLNKNSNREVTWQTLKRPLYIFGLFAVLIYIQPDLGNVLIIFGILFAAMWMAKVPTRILSFMIGLIVFTGIVGIATTPYRLGRFNTVFNPNSATTAEKYQTTNAQKAITNGGIWGLGYGNSEAKQNSSVPESSNDAIIAIIGEEVGFVVMIIFLSLYVVFCFRGLKIAQEAPDVGGLMLASGITFWIVSQAFLNVGGITGIVPLKGLPLPFVSKGGSAMVLNLAAVGILLNVSSQGKNDDKKNGSREKPMGFVSAKRLRKKKFN